MFRAILCEESHYRLFDLPENLFGYQEEVEKWTEVVVFVDKEGP